VDVAITYRVKLGMLSRVLPNPFPVKAHSVMRTE
jgi:hypothetical protein